MISVETILKKVYVLQEKKNEQRVGRGFTTLIRINPYNPLSYVSIVVGCLISLLLYGIVGTFENVKNPFRWQ